MKHSKAETPPPYGFILASVSPRRRELLAILGLPVLVVLPSTHATGQTESGAASAAGGVDETPLPGEAPVALVQRLSQAKAQTIATLLPSLAASLDVPFISPGTEQSMVLIATDTIVVFEDRILGKPADPAEATHMLKGLRQRCHQVYSGLTLMAGFVFRAPPAGPLEIYTQEPTTSITRLHRSNVWMRAYSDTEIAAYVASGDPLDKAGAYGIQHKTFAPVERLEGCFASVMGLPLGELAAALAEIGLPLPPMGPLCANYTGYPCCQENL